MLCEPKKVIQALTDPSWIEAMQEELLNKKNERGIVVRNKARLVAQGYTQEEGIDYNEFLDKVFKVEKDLYGLHQAPRAWYETLSTYLLENRYRRGTIDKNLFIKKDIGDILLVQLYVDDIIFGSTKKVQQKEDGIFISQDKYVVDIFKKFDFTTVKAASTLIETNKALNKDELVLEHLQYRFQVTPKVSHLHAVKRIFRYLKGQPKLGLWYPRDSPFDLEAFYDSDYVRASHDRKSTIGGCQFFGKRLISWQCKKQTIVANSTTEAEYVAAANCYGQVLWIQNQMLDYGFNFMNTKIHIDNESTIFFMDKQVEGMTRHKEVYVTLSHTKEVFANMKISGNGFSSRVTPIFPTMMVQATEDMGADSTTLIDSHSTPIPTTEETTHEEHERVLDLEKAMTAQAKEITSLKKRVKQLEKRRKSRTLGLRRLRKVGSSSRVESSIDASLGAQEDASKQGRKIEDLDADCKQEIKFEKVVEESVVSFATTTKSITVSATEVVPTASDSVEIPDELTLA
ncbi:putative ribonuclease H-like domain-containing protein [Tanacetum coccineum]